jgi:riboflavin biosynthesis pyrimidine reductase
VQRLAPDPGPTSVAEQLEAYRPWDEPPADRPRLALNFATTLDGRASIDGRSGPIGSDTDTAMLVGLRQRFDAVMIGAGTMRVEQYGRIIGDLPWDAPLFTAGGGRVLILTSDEEGEPPATATPVEVVREPGGPVDMAWAMRLLRADHDVRAVLCEGGPRLHSQLQAAGLADELFLTIAPKLVGAGTTILEGALPEVAELELAWLLAEGSELFARYGRA